MAKAGSGQAFPTHESLDRYIPSPRQEADDSLLPPIGYCYGGHKFTTTGQLQVSENTYPKCDILSLWVLS